MLVPLRVNLGVLKIVVPIVHNDPRDSYVVARDATPIPAMDNDNTVAAKDSQPLESRGSPRDPAMPPKRRSQTNPPPLLTQEAVNQLVATLGLKVANGKPWTEVKQMMTDEFCPTKEVQRLEDELRHLKLMDMNIVAYTERFNELALLCHDVVPNEKKKVELYIKGLPEIIKGETTSSRPAMLNEAVRMAHTLMEQKIQDKAERIAESNKRKWESNNNNYHNNNRGNYRDNDLHNQYNDRRQGSARAMTTAQNDDVDQGGPTPNCNHCGLCHFGQCPSKCNRCGRRVHKANDCRKRIVAAGTNARPIRACNECGDRNHSLNQCPNLANQRGGNATDRAYVMREVKKGQGPNVVAGMFLINNHYANVLFDYGSDMSFVNTSSSHLIDIKPVKNEVLVVKGNEGFIFVIVSSSCSLVLAR
ncbi:putative reverse transcriptase domain-containing protein [Tanacetum coccineum]|uniref:Reverse transcriptase domain-containing protein n=1 Tax=Tanacetum coccineum TaxID=301880 RepID=A0ABQ5GD56_9ASTR